MLMMLVMLDDANNTVFYDDVVDDGDVDVM